MEKQDILNKVTETIRKCLEQGYKVYPEAMRGSQGQDFAFAAVIEGEVGVAISAWNTGITAIDGCDAYEIWHEVFDVKAFEKSGDRFWFQSEADWKLGKPVVERYYNINHRYIPEEEALKVKNLIKKVIEK